MTHEITAQNFEESVLHAEGAVLLDFRAQWCFPCKMLARTLRKLEAEHPEIKICQVDVDTQPELAAQFGIMSIPTLIAYRDGKQLDRFTGALSKRAILAMFK